MILKVYQRWLFFLTALFIVHACQNVDNHHKIHAQIPLNELQTGDIILRRGEGLVSRYIAENFGGSLKWSHCGIIVCDSSGVKVVHTQTDGVHGTDGVRKENLNSFISEARSGSVCILRFRSLNNEHRIKVCEFLNDAQIRKIPFDMQFDITDSSAYYCTELVYRCFLRASGVNIYKNVSFDEKPGFEALYDTIFFKTIYHQNELR